MTLAEKLKSARENAGYSQSQVAERLNISRQAVSRWENGRAYPDIDNLVVLSEIYKVSIDELLKDKSADEQDEVNTEIEVEPEERNNRLAVLMVAISGTLFPGGGLVIMLAVLLYCGIKRIELPKVYKVIIAVCFVINLINVGVLIKSFESVFAEWL